MEHLDFTMQPDFTMRPDFTVRSAAHDIRGYLASASLATEHLSAHDDEQVSRRADRIARAIDQVVTICQTDLGKSHPSQTTTHHSSAAIHAVLEQVAALISPQFEDRFGHPKFTVTVAGDVTIDCHQTSLFRIIYNLAVNAAHAIRTHVGSSVELSAIRDGDQIRFSVADDGPGLPAHILNHLYPRIDQTTHRTSRIGYGLMTAVGLAKEMKGDLHLINSSQDGAEFCLVLPKTPR